MSESYEPYNDAERMDMIKGIEELGAVMGMGAVAGEFGTGLVLRTLRYEATIAQIEAERDVWKAERKEAVEVSQAMVARVKRERDEARRERDALREEVEGAYEAHAALVLERDVLKDELADAKADRESWRHIALHV